MISNIYYINWNDREMSRPAMRIILSTWLIRVRNAQINNEIPFFPRFYSTLYKKLQNADTFLLACFQMMEKVTTDTKTKPKKGLVAET